jgi:hypothetical protein
MSESPSSSWDDLYDCLSGDVEFGTPNWEINSDIFTVPDDIELQTSDVLANDATSRNPSNHISSNACHGPNRIRKGAGSDGKTYAPDAYDGYRFEQVSPAFHTLRLLGYAGITLMDLDRVSNIVNAEARKLGISLTVRNRAAHRRKPCVFHWLDVNWEHIRGFYINAVVMVLGRTSGVKKRGPRKECRVGTVNTKVC